jgi:hypothetical protein
MSYRHNPLARLWQELKRRRVFGVVTAYAATAYMIIEVTNNLSVPLPVLIIAVIVLAYLEVFMQDTLERLKCIFQKAYDTAPYKMYFMKSHLEEVIKTLANQVNNKSD